MFPLRNPYELPAPQLSTYRDARRLAAWTALYLVTAGAALYAVSGTSEAMRAAWLETVFSVTTPVVFVLGSEAARWPPGRRFPYGFSRCVSIAFLVNAATLFLLGLYLIVDALAKVGELGTARGAPLGQVELLGRAVWLGWPVLAALAWSAVPAWLMGRRQRRRAGELHDKVLVTDAGMRTADWLTALAGGMGVLGLETGYSFVDPLAAIFIALTVLWSGVRQLRHALADLADSAPTRLDGSWDPLPGRVRDHLLGLPWVADARVRLREEGRLIFGDAFVVPRGDEELTRNIDAAVAAVHGLDWRIASFAIMPVPARAMGDAEGRHGRPAPHQEQARVVA